MIALLTGSLIDHDGARGILDVRGVGYEVFAPAGCIAQWNVAQTDVVAHIYTHVSEDSLTLYGFNSREARKTFSILLGVSGVGPKVALATLDAHTVESLTRAVEAGDIAALGQIKGVGKKTAQRMAIDLKGKLPQHFAVQGSTTGFKRPTMDALPLALERLGYSRGEINKAVDTLISNGMGPDEPVAARLRAALAVLSGAQ